MLVLSVVSFWQRLYQLHFVSMFCFQFNIGFTRLNKKSQIKQNEFCSRWLSSWAKRQFCTNYEKHFWRYVLRKYWARLFKGYQLDSKLLQKGAVSNLTGTGCIQCSKISCFWDKCWWVYKVFEAVKGKMLLQNSPVLNDFDYQTFLSLKSAVHCAYSLHFYGFFRRFGIVNLFHARFLIKYTQPDSLPLSSVLNFSLIKVRLEKPVFKRPVPGVLKGTFNVTETFKGLNCESLSRLRKRQSKRLWRSTSARSDSYLLKNFSCSEHCYHFLYHRFLW